MVRVLDLLLYCLRTLIWLILQTPPHLQEDPSNLLGLLVPPIPTSRFFLETTSQFCQPRSNTYQFGVPLPRFLLSLTQWGIHSEPMHSTCRFLLTPPSYLPYRVLSVPQL